MKRHGPEDPPEDDAGWLPFGEKDLSRAHARRLDPETSHAAAESIREEKLTRLRSIILDTLRRYGPAIDYRTIDRIRAAGHRYSRSGIQTRRDELVTMGLVRDSGRREVTEYGRAAIIWEAVDISRISLDAGGSDADPIPGG